MTRLPTTHGPTTGYEALRGSAAAHLVRRDVVLISGPDARAYLQGQCSQDVDALTPGSSVEALLLSPQGKVDVYVRLSSLGDAGLVLDTDPGFGARAIARLERFRLRTKVEFEPLPWQCIGVRGPEAPAAIAEGARLVLPVEWPGLSGFDLLGPAEDTPAGWVAAGTAWCDGDAWEAARIESGAPRNGREVIEGTIAAEVGLVERTVSFTKGCFTGQELVARLDARGSKVARRLCGVVLDPAGGPGGEPWAPESLVGLAVRTADGSDAVGHLSSVTWSPGLGAMVALATLHRRIVPPAPVVVGGEPQDGDGGPRSLTGEARPLPLVPAPTEE